MNRKNLLKYIATVLLGSVAAYVSIKLPLLHAETIFFLTVIAILIIYMYANKKIRYMIQLTKLKPRGDYAYEEGIQMVWTAWTRPRCCFNSDFCRTKGSGIHFVVLVVGIKSNLAYILIFRRYFFRYLGRRADC